MEKYYYSLSEVAQILGEAPSLVRFWSNSFPKHVKPVRNAKGNRQFKAEDIEALKQIHYLVKEKGLTLDGAAKAMASDKDPVVKKVRIIETLKVIREQLVEVRKTI